MARLAGYVGDGRLAICGWGAGPEEVLAKASEAQRRDPRLEPADLLIAAVALVCEPCSHLYVAERRMVESTALREMFRESGKGLGEAPARDEVLRQRRRRYGGRA